MDKEKVIKHYLQFSTFTYPGCYLERLKSELPNDIRELGLLIRKNLIHRAVLTFGNTGMNADLKFGDMTKMPWWRQPEDDNLPTTGAILTELYRRDPRGFVLDREPKDKLVVTCRFVSILMAAVLKAKGIPTRCRAGNAPYFMPNISIDHWVNQYWDKEKMAWVTIDVDGSLAPVDFDPYNIPSGKFDFPADAWLGIRAEHRDADYFRSMKPEKGAIVVLWSLFYDFHSLMNSEIIYLHTPRCGTYEKFFTLTEEELKKIDHLAQLMQKPDENFDELVNIWENEKSFRLLVGGLLH
jgi:hypothetical protein